MLLKQQTIISNNALEQECFDLYQSQGLTGQVIKKFQKTIYEFYNTQARSFPWRSNITDYRIVVSEIMLQQTQTYRVEKKFDEFVHQFPSFNALANAPFHEVLRYWKGLGYNRRALNLQKIAHIIVNQFQEKLPNTPKTLETFPGIGSATARSICAFVFNQPHVFIETNIRTVFIYFFFKEFNSIHDKDLLPFIEKTLDQQHSREWYYALMDYGVMLKKTVGNLCKLSRHYTKQSKFEDSDRQIRGMILQELINQSGISKHTLIKNVGKDEKRTLSILDQLIKEGFIKYSKNELLLS